MSKQAKTIIWLIRHAIAGGNESHLLNGNMLDPPLTPVGKRQAQLLAKGWKEKPDIVLTSPLIRAKQTAKYFEMKYGIKAIEMDELMERDCGKYSGMEAGTLRKKHPSYFFNYGDGEKSNFLKIVPEGEGWAKLRKRAKRAVGIIKKRYSGKKIVAISHEDLIAAMVSALYSINPPELLNYRLKNADFVKFAL